MDIDSIVNSVLEKESITLKEGESNISIYIEKLGSKVADVYHWNFNDKVYHPASLIKLFNSYLAKVKLLSQVKQVLSRSEDSEDFGERTITDDVYDAIHESLAVSDNDALALLVDFNSDTSSGLRLDHKSFAEFALKRKKITDIFRSKSYSDDLRLHGKCFSFAPYGRDEQLVFSKQGLGTNSCTIEDAAKILRDIYRDFPELYKSMSRVIGNEEDEQTQFIAKGLEDYKGLIKDYYSKAGWTSKVRHDAALIRLKDEQEILLVIMTKGLSEYIELIPSISKVLFERCKLV